MEGRKPGVYIKEHDSIVDPTYTYTEIEEGSNGTVIIVDDTGAEFFIGIDHGKVSIRNFQHREFSIKPVVSNTIQLRAEKRGE